MKPTGTAPRTAAVAGRARQLEGHRALVLSLLGIGVEPDEVSAAGVVLAVT
jgi:hypothetical protein